MNNFSFLPTVYSAMLVLIFAPLAVYASAVTVTENDYTTEYKVKCGTSPMILSEAEAACTNEWSLAVVRSSEANAKLTSLIPQGERAWLSGFRKYTDMWRWEWPATPRENVTIFGTDICTAYCNFDNKQSPTRYQCGYAYATQNDRVVVTSDGKWLATYAEQTREKRTVFDQPCYTAKCYACQRFPCSISDGKCNTQNTASASGYVTGSPGDTSKCTCNCKPGYKGKFCGTPDLSATTTSTATKDTTAAKEDTTAAKEEANPPLKSDSLSPMSATCYVWCLLLLVAHFW